jgi:capsular exopolysaccharide synthesis family protein
MPEQAPQTDSEVFVQKPGDALDLHEYWRTLLRRRWVAIPFLVATLALTGIVTLRMTKIYDATCTIIIDLAAPKVLEKESVQEVVETGNGGYWFAKEFYETQYKVITSRAVAQRVIEKLQLGSNLAFLELEDVKDPGELARKAAARDPYLLLEKRLHVEPVKDSRVVRIRFEDPDPKFAALVANTVAEAYIAENLAVKTTMTASAGDWLEHQLSDLERKLDDSGRALFDFKKKHDIVATSWEDRQSMVSQRLTQINDALTKARVRKAELQARTESIEEKIAALDKGVVDPSVQALIPVAPNAVIEQLKLRYFEAQSECADLKVKYLSDHPKLEACEKKLTMARNALREEIQTTLAAFRKEFQDVVTTERNLQKLLDVTKQEAFGLNQYERDYLELKRTHENNQRLYELVLKRLKDTGIAGMLQVSNVRILDRARPGLRPVRPNPVRNLGFALVLGLVGSVALAFLVESLDRTITSQQQIEERLGLAFLGIVPRLERTKEGASRDLLVHEEPKSAAAECLRAVRTNLLFMSPEKPLRTILVTSSGPQEGKTTTVTSLAITMAASGNRVLLIDADMRRPRVHRVFGTDSAAGLSSLILGEGRLDDAIKPTQIDRLFMLPCGPIPPNPAELLHTAAFRKLLGEMAERFDRVVVDSPPVGVVADAAVIGTHVDGTLVVLRAGKTDRDAAQQAVRQLRDVKAPILGVVLNDLDLEEQRYGHYSYSYYYRYGYYYGDAGPTRQA